jgi:hydroxyacylglutathione hydrolase
MLFERIESAGIAHYSYLIGDGSEAAVIDPRRDCDAYVERAFEAGMRIAHVLETHRHEDFVTGSVELAAKTGASVWHADAQWAYGYGRPANDAQTWKLGSLTLEAIHSPGHTPGSMSYLLRDADGAPWFLFTGDALFAGEVGRVDLLGMDRAKEMAGLLHDTIHTKFLPLGDGVIVCPAHGAGSVCGTAIADRPWTSIGLERASNPRLAHGSKEAFVADVARELERPPYFTVMERLNLAGPPVRGGPLVPPPLSPAVFEARSADAVVLDARSELAYASAHVPTSFFIWPDAVGAFAGWFLPYDKPILLVCETKDVDRTARALFRLGFDSVAGFLSGGMLAWSMGGHRTVSTRVVSAHELKEILSGGARVPFLDVRGPDELARVRPMAGARNIHVTLLPGRLEEVPPERPLYVICGSGMRSMIGASILERHGERDTAVVLGGYAGWKASGGGR